MQKKKYYSFNKKRNFNLNKEGNIYAKIDKTKKIPVIILLQALGISTKKALFSIKSPELLTIQKAKINTRSTKEALFSINEILREQNKNKNIV